MRVPRGIIVAWWRPLAMACAVTATGCGDLPPRGQIVLYVTTDAPLLPALGEDRSFEEGPALFDRLRFDFYGPDAETVCGECSRTFNLTAEAIETTHLTIDAASQDGASVGIIPTDPWSPGVARLRMFLAAHELAPGPNRKQTVDLWLALPPIPQDEVTEVHVVMRTEDVGVSIGSRERGVEPKLGRPPPGLVGSWPHARRRFCSSNPMPGEVCVPGGAFWMPVPGSAEPRLVVLSPFFVGDAEVTVAELRASGVPVANDPIRWSGLVPESPPKNQYYVSSYSHFCTFTDEPDLRDGFAVNCLTKSLAEAFCSSRGQTLPTQAQLTYLQSGLRGTPYVWGHDNPSCKDAVVDRGFDHTSWGDGRCRTPQRPPTSTVAGTGLRDRLELDGQEILDLNGNVLELTADRPNTPDESCWAAPLLYDPFCASPSAHWGGWQAVGGSWAKRGRAGSALLTLAGTEDSSEPRAGVRCARSDLADDP